MEKYYNDAIIGNKEMIASFTKKGELLRLFYPNTDYRQFIDFFHTGVKINDSALIFLHNDINNVYKQKYIEDTNILKTEIINTYFKMDIIQTDYICINKNILVKKYKFINKNDIELETNFVIHSSLLTDNNNQVTGFFKNNSLIQYMHDYSFTITSNQKIIASQINNSIGNISEGKIGDKDYIGMSNNSSICYDLGIIKPGEEKELEILINISEFSDIKNIESKIEEIKNIDTKKELEVAKKYWRKYLKEHNTIELPTHQSEYMDKLKRIYKRTILLFPLLTNQETGGISAGVEIDEERTKCGRYSYCWPRDRNFYNKCIRYTKHEKRNRKILQNIL